ncbi:MAG: hypothetical protein DWH91_02360 [Planctomycetota bacterium]|nr:MAG: hypothetical protein DWH91_02360 [Planctomycetota bacterium]
MCVTKAGWDFPPHRAHVRLVEEFTGVSYGASAGAVTETEPLLVLKEVPQTAQHVQSLDATSDERVNTATG